MRRTGSAAVVLCVVIVATAAHAQSRRSSVTGTTASRSTNYSIFGADTVPAGVDVAEAEFGWPAITFGFLHGLSPTSDVGVKFDLLFGVEGESQDGFSQFGIGARVPFRIHALRKDKVGVLFHVDPGIKLHTFSPAWFGIAFPVGVTFAYAAHNDFTVAFGVDLPMTLFVTPSPVAFFIGPQFGPAFEYHVDRELTIGLNTRFGPVIRTATPGFDVPGVSGNGTEFGFTIELGLGYRL
ncbi:MAG: hypothetical protein ACJ783_07930 [Myxococcales bacterium]